MLNFQWIDDLRCKFEILQKKYVQSYCCCYQVDDFSFMCNVKNDAVPAEAGETHSHMQPVVVLNPVVVLETIDFDQ